MTPHEYLSRHGGRLAIVLLVGIAAAAPVISAARAEVAPPAALTSLNAIKAVAVAELSKVTKADTPVKAQSPAKVAITFSAPLPGFAVNSPFGMRELDSEDHARVHEGVDIAAPQGEAIHATAAGQVLRAGLSASYGNFAEIDHGDGITSFYAHMRRPAEVRAGDHVNSGQVLGYVGSTGHSTGPHLHFEVRRNGEHFDPSLFMGHAFASLADLPFFHSAERGFGAWRTQVTRASYHFSRHTLVRRSGRVHHFYAARHARSTVGG